MNARQLTLLIRAIDAGGKLELAGRELPSAKVLNKLGFGFVTRADWINGSLRQLPPNLIVYSDIMTLAAALRRSGAAKANTLRSTP